MSAPENLDRLVAEWLTAAAPTSAPAALNADLAEAVHSSRQHPRWLARARIRATDGSEARRLAGTVALVGATLALIVLALLAVALFAGSQRRVPPPFGLAGNGLMAFDSDGAIYTADATGIVTMKVPRGGLDHGAPNWSLDGQHLAYWTWSETDNWLSVLSPDGAPLDIALDRAVEPHLGRPQWSPDSRSIVFAASTPDGERLEIVDLATSAIREIVLEDNDVRFPIWSPDGEWIAFYGTAAHTFKLRLSLVHPDGSGLVRLPTSVLPTAIDDYGEFAWSPDPHVSQLLYVFNGNGVGDIALFDVTTGREVIVSDDVTNEFWPTWSPDGRHIAWYYADYDQAEVRVADIGPGPTVTGIRSVLTAPRSADGEGPNCGNTPSLAGRFMCQRPEWSPDGQHIYAGDVLGTQIMVIDSDGEGSIRHIPVPATGLVTWQRIAP